MPESAEAEARCEIAHVLTMAVVDYGKLSPSEQSAAKAKVDTAVEGSTRFRVADAAGKVIRSPAVDGLTLAFFGDASAAMECAVEVVTELKGKSDIRLRMGLHSGSVNRALQEKEEPKLAGDTIQTTQGVTDCGDSGHILLSKRIAYELAPMARWNADLYELGEAEVKPGNKISLVNFYTDEVGNRDLPEKLRRAQKETARRVLLRSLGRQLIRVAILACGIAFVAGLYLYAQRQAHVEAIAPPPPPEKSIAVLPFADLSPARDQEYFADGISEELLGDLSKIEGLRTVAATSSFSFKGKNMDAGEICRRLGVANIVKGGVRHDGSRVRVTVEVVSARDNSTTWSGENEKEIRNVLALEDEITGAIANALKINPGGVPRVRPQQNPDAYNLYLHGLSLSNKDDEADLSKSLELLTGALQRDPRVGRAWTVSAKDWNRLAHTSIKPVEAETQVENAAKRALSVDDRDAEARVYLGEAERILTWDVAGEESELKKALQVDPNSAVGRVCYSFVRAALGDRDGSLKEARKAVQLDPLSPAVANNHVEILVQAGRLDDALSEAKRLLEIDTTYAYFEPALALVYREQGKLQDALDIYLRLQQTKDEPSPGLAITYARMGKREEARKVLDELIRIANTRYSAADQIAAVYIALGENDEAFQWLDRAMQERSATIHRIAFAREFQALRTDARFADVLHRIGLSENHLSGSPTPGR